jgi:hypothetical protein
LVGKILAVFLEVQQPFVPTERANFLWASVAKLGTGARQPLNCLVANTLITDGRIVRADDVLKGARTVVPVVGAGSVGKEITFTGSRVRKASRVS